MVEKMVIDNIVLNNLTKDAQSSNRLRINFDLRNSSCDASQRMLNALEPGTIIPVHRHNQSSETVCVIRGTVRQNFYSDEGNLIETIVISASSSCPIFVVPIAAWHNSEALESGTIIFEAKDGAYEPVNPADVLPETVILKAKLKDFIEQERRSASMEVITPEYVWRMWEGRVQLDKIVEALGSINAE